LNCCGQSPRPLTQPLYEVFFVKRKICVVSGPGRRVGGPLDARSCPSKPWRRKMSLARRLSRPKPPEAVAEGVPGMGTGLEVKVLRGARW
jgi:hypothetical protein